MHRRQSGGQLKARPRTYSFPVAAFVLPHRAVFSWVSKVIHVLLWFCFTLLCDWLKISRHFLDQSEVKLKPVASSRLRFPALGASYMYLLRVLIGSLCNLCSLWLAGIITLDLVLRHSLEKRSSVFYFGVSPPSLVVFISLICLFSLFVVRCILSGPRCKLIVFSFSHCCCHAQHISS